MLLAQVLHCSLQIGAVAVDPALGEQFAVLAEQQRHGPQAAGESGDAALHDAVDHAVDDVILLELRTHREAELGLDAPVALRDLPQEGRPDALQQRHLLMDAVLARQLGDQPRGRRQLVLSTGEVEVVPVHTQLAEVVVELRGLALGLVLRAGGLAIAAEQRQEDGVVDLLPVAERADDLVGSVIEDQREGVDALASEDPEAGAEVVVGEVGDERAELLVLAGETGLAFELVGQHAVRPDGADGEEEGVLAPLLHRLGLYLQEGAVLQRPLQVLQQREPLLHLPPQLARPSLQEALHPPAQPDPVLRVDLPQHFLKVLQQSLEAEPLLAREVDGRAEGGELHIGEGGGGTGGIAQGVRLGAQLGGLRRDLGVSAVAHLLPLHYQSITVGVALLLNLEDSRQLRPQNQPVVVGKSRPIPISKELLK